MLTAPFLLFVTGISALMCAAALWWELRDPGVDVTVVYAVSFVGFSTALVFGLCFLLVESEALGVIFGT